MPQRPEAAAAAESRGKPQESENPRGRWCRARLPRPTRCLLGPPGLAVTTLATSRPRVQKHAIAGAGLAALGSAADYSLFTQEIGAVSLVGGHPVPDQAGKP